MLVKIFYVLEDMLIVCSVFRPTKGKVKNKFRYKHGHFTNGWCYNAFDIFIMEVLPFICNYGKKCFES